VPNDDPTRRAPPPGDEARYARAALALILAFALARAALAYSIGFGVDESYTIAISRRLDLSYFDHPPLHQWIAHFAALVLGEGPALRLPFIALFAATGWLMFALTRELFGARAGFWATFALNATGFFLVSAGAWVVPDGPLLLALAAAGLVFAKLLLGRPDKRAAWRLWVAGGFWLGVAGLSKYNAVFFAVGLVAFVALSPRQRHWLARPAPYVAALISLAMITPVVVWNARNGWISLAFQGVRGAPGGQWRPVQLVAMVLGEIAWLTPWIFVPLLGGLIAAIRLAERDERRLFLLCLALPPIVLFTLTPLWGARGLPHWPMPGWLFAYPLLGVWLVEGWAQRLNLRRWAIGSTALIAVIVVALASQTATGWITRALPLPRGVVDPTLEALSWAPLASAPLIAADPAPTFVVSTKWSEGGKITLALGPRVPVIVASDDPRGMAFLEDSADFVGKDAVIVVPEAKLSSVTASLSPFFASLGAPQKLILQRGGRDEIALALIPAQSLTRPFPLPYPRRVAPSPSAKALQ
jgi:hypothetical protein